MKRTFKSYNKAIFSVLLVVNVLLLDAMAACPALHELIHKDADCASHECAVTMFAHGQVDSTTVEVAPMGMAITIETTPQPVFSFFSPSIGNLPAGRAPPVSFSHS